MLWLRLPRRLDIGGIGVPADGNYDFQATKEEPAATPEDRQSERSEVCRDRAGFLGKAAWDIEHPLDVLGFSPSQVRKAEPGTLLNHIVKNGIEIVH